MILPNRRATFIFLWCVAQVRCFRVHPPSSLPRRSLLKSPIDVVSVSCSSQLDDDSVDDGTVALPSTNGDQFLGRTPCKIVVCGVGGGGGNAINHMIESDLNNDSDLIFWAINTDAQALAKNKSPNKLNIGRELTRGLGAGGNPKQGAKAAVESARDMKEMCKGADMVFITAGELLATHMDRAEAMTLWISFCFVSFGKSRNGRWHWVWSGPSLGGNRKV